MSQRHTVIVVGAGPAGLAAASELSNRQLDVVVLEKDAAYVGGIARTVQYNGYRFDIGGHRFFSKSPEIMAWWKERLPADLLEVQRKSRIFYKGRFFTYPLKPLNALVNLGIGQSLLCILSYLLAQLFPYRNPRSFDQWVTNRFGARLFRIFFKTYTEKVWGMPCQAISADWAAQRIKSFSLGKAIWNAFVFRRREPEAIATTLIDHFYYPRLGPGMMWERAREDLTRQNVQFHLGQEIIGIRRSDELAHAVLTRGSVDGTTEWRADHFIVSMPLQDCVLAFDPPLSAEVQQAARNLQYRDFIVVALILKTGDVFPDQWLYVHDPSVKVGRIQNFNNWSADLVPDPGCTCLGLEYFANTGDELWSLPDVQLKERAAQELQQLGIADAAQVVDGSVVRVEKAYPAYYHGYRHDVEVIRTGLARLRNFQIVGRAGMHRYNNQDHAMMTGMLAARNVMGGQYNVWNVNNDGIYLEEGLEGLQGTGRLVPQELKQ